MRVAAGLSVSLLLLFTSPECSAAKKHHRKGDEAGRARGGYAHHGANQGANRRAQDGENDFQWVEAALEDVGNEALANAKTGKEHLISGNNIETEHQRYQRLGLGEKPWFEVPEGDGTGEEPKNFPPRFDPLEHAKCFNDDYHPNPYTTSQEGMRKIYQKFVRRFDWGFKNKMGSPLQSVSMGNNKVTNNRFPGMCLRMAFHDNAVKWNNTFKTDPQDYIDDGILCYSGKFGETGLWKGTRRNMETSGADSSVLICPEERFHPNNNYDNTASRVLYMFQHEMKDEEYEGYKNTMVDYTGWSYTDLLYNCAVAAGIFMTYKPQDEEEIDAALEKYPFQVGRRDACYTVPYERYEKRALCGPTEVLPSVVQPVDEVDRWFRVRSMKSWNFLIQMWTHTSMDNMAHECPLMKLGYIAKEGDLPFFPTNADAHYLFGEGDSADYFHLLCGPGFKHDPSDKDEDDLDFERANCKFTRQLSELKTYMDWLPHTLAGKDYLQIHWPMTIFDCRLGCDQVTEELEDIIKIFKDMTKKDKLEALMCTLGMLGGRGEDAFEDCKNQATHVNRTFYSTEYGFEFMGDHSFGAYFGKECPAYYGYGA